MGAVKQFDVYENPDPETAAFVGHLAVVSSHYASIDTVLVAPLLSDGPADGVADVIVVFARERRRLSLINMTALDPRRLKRHAGSLSSSEDAIRRGIDRLFTGF